MIYLVLISCAIFSPTKDIIIAQVPPFNKIGKVDPVETAKIVLVIREKEEIDEEQWQKIKADNKKLVFGLLLMIIGLTTFIIGIYLWKIGK